jgi:hypothetical protein
MNILYLQIAAAIFIALASLEFRGVCRIKKKSVVRFIKVMLVVTVVRVVLAHLTGQGHDPNPNSPMNTIKMVSLLGVFWEDTFFTLPILIARKMGASKLLLFIMLAISSATFASGHLAYSPLWAAITLFYIPFVSYKYGKLNGLGTVMVCHILYDIITIATVRYLI